MFSECLSCALYSTVCSWGMWLFFQHLFGKLCSDLHLRAVESAQTVVKAQGELAKGQYYTWWWEAGPIHLTRVLSALQICRLQLACVLFPTLSSESYLSEVF